MYINDLTLRILHSNLNLSQIANATVKVTPNDGQFAGRQDTFSKIDLNFTNNYLDFIIPVNYLNICSAENLKVNLSVVLKDGSLNTADLDIPTQEGVYLIDNVVFVSGGSGEPYDDTVITARVNALQSQVEDINVQVDAVESKVATIETEVEDSLHSESIHTIEQDGDRLSVNSKDYYPINTIIVNGEYKRYEADGVIDLGTIGGGDVPENVEVTDNKKDVIDRTSSTDYPSVNGLIKTLKSGLNLQQEWEFKYNQIGDMPMNLETTEDAYYILVYNQTDGAQAWIQGFNYRLADKTKPVYLLNYSTMGNSINHIGPDNVTLVWGQYIRYNSSTDYGYTVGYESELWTTIPSIPSLQNGINNALSSANEAKEHIKIESIQAIDVILPESHPTGSNYVGDHWCFRPTDEDIALSLHAIGDKQDTIFRLKDVYPARSGVKRVQVVVDNDMYASDPHNIYVINDTDDDVDILNDSWSTLSIVHPHTIALFVNGDNRVYASEISDYTGTSQCTICQYDGEAFEEDLPKTVTYVNDAVVALDSRVSALEQGGTGGSQITLLSTGQIIGVKDELGNDVENLYAGTITIN